MRSEVKHRVQRLLDRQDEAMRIASPVPVVESLPIPASQESIKLRAFLGPLMEVYSQPLSESDPAYRYVNFFQVDAFPVWIFEQGYRSVEQQEWIRRAAIAAAFQGKIPVELLMHITTFSMLLEEAPANQTINVMPILQKDGDFDSRLRAWMEARFARKRAGKDVDAQIKRFGEHMKVLLETHPWCNFYVTFEKGNTEFTSQFNDFFRIPFSIDDQYIILSATAYNVFRVVLSGVEEAVLSLGRLGKVTRGMIFSTSRVGVRLYSIYGCEPEHKVMTAHRAIKGAFAVYEHDRSHVLLSENIPLFIRQKLSSIAGIIRNQLFKLYTAQQIKLRPPEYSFRLAQQALPSWDKAVFFPGAHFPSEIWKLIDTGGYDLKELGWLPDTSDFESISDFLSEIVDADPKQALLVQEFRDVREDLISRNVTPCCFLLLLYLKENSDEKINYSEFLESDYYRPVCQLIDAAWPSIKSKTLGEQVYILCELENDPDLFPIKDRSGISKILLGGDIFSRVQDSDDLIREVGGKICSIEYEVNFAEETFLFTLSKSGCSPVDIERTTVSSKFSYGSEWG